MRNGKKTLSIKDLTKIVKSKVGAGFTTPYIERTIELFTKEIVKALMEGKRVRLGKLTLKAEIQETPFMKQTRDPRTGEKTMKEYKPYIKFKILPRKIEFEKVKELDNIRQELMTSLTLTK